MSLLQGEKMEGKKQVMEINDELNKQWVIEMNEELNKMEDASAESTNWSKRSIYRIPASVTDLNKKAYKPHIVSFGPYHHGSENLRAMEEHKRRAVLHFLKRSKKPLHSFVQALTPVVQDLKDAYDQLDPKWLQNDDAFLKLLIVDGCFLLEIFRTTTAWPQTTQVEMSQPQSGDQDYPSNDPIFSTHGKLYTVPYLKRDMLMLENQVPMLLLEKLVSVQDDTRLKEEGLIKLILNFFFFQTAAKHLSQFDKCLHILDVYRKILVFKESLRLREPKKKGSQRYIHFGGEIIRSTTELIEAGIRIRRSKTRSLSDISFHNGVLRLPLVVVDDAFESLYLNLIAFERFHVGAGNEVTSYIFFMDNIIDSARDVSLLHSSGIIQNALSGDNIVANLFKSLSKDITLDPSSSLGEVHKKVSAYCQKPWKRWRANFIHNYFNDRWATLVLTILLFYLTILQTAFGVLSYFKSPS